MDDEKILNDLNTDLLEDLADWADDHLKGSKTVTITRGRSKAKKVSFNEFRSTRLELLLAIDDLEEALYTHLHLGLKRLAAKQFALSTPPREAVARFDLLARQARDRCVERCKESIRTLLEAKSKDWEDFERKFSDKEISIFEANFGSMSTDLLVEASRDFSSTIGVHGHHLMEKELAARRRAEMVETFLEKCREQIHDVKIEKQDIWRAARHESPRQFQYWKAGEDRPTGTTRGATRADDKNFRRILGMDTEDFRTLLPRMGIK